MADVDAWSRFPEHRWVYYKPGLCDIQGIEWAPCPVVPSSYPVVVRPMTNLCGMGAGMQIVQTAAEYDDACCHGFFWTPVAIGKHTSHDFHMEDGRLVSETIFTGTPMHEFPGAFLHWQLDAYKREPVRTPAMKHLEERLRGYSGALNVECIGDRIIEVHLRSGDERLAAQFYESGAPLYLVPIWHDPLDGPPGTVDVDALRAEEGVLDVLLDTTDMSSPGCGLQRCALVVTRQLPEFASNGAPASWWEASDMFRDTCRPCTASSIS